MLRIEVQVSNDVADPVIFDVLLLISIFNWVNLLRPMRYFAH
jgi:hypothetical protein